VRKAEVENLNLKMRLKNKELSNAVETRNLLVIEKAKLMEEFDERLNKIQEEFNKEILHLRKQNAEERVESRLP
jgi:hypothetical protein